VSATFSVGEVALIHAPGGRYHGAEVTIIESLHMYTPVNSCGALGDPVEGYTIAGDSLPPYAFKTGKGWGIARQNLRKRRPPQDWKSICNLTDAPRELETA
jgi:hypothetical protein